MASVGERIADREHLIRQFRHRATAAGIRDITAYALHEVARQKRGRIAAQTLRHGKAIGHEFSEKERRMLERQGQRRYRASEKSTRMLGGLEDSLALRLVEGKRIEVFSKARIGAIHNFGGTAGHGARIPRREFMFLVDGDMEFLAGLLREQMIDAWTNAA